MARIPPALLLALAVASALLAGCSADSGEGPTGTLAVALAGGAPDDVAFTLGGIYARTDGGDGNATWKEAAPAGASWNVSAAAEPATVEGSVAAGGYERIRVLFDNVTVAGRPAVLTKTGLELPVPFTVPEGGRIALLLEIAWPEALYESAEGLTFDPVLAGLELTGPGGTARIEAQNLTGAATPPVARIQAFDATGLQVFVSDFVADSPSRRAIGTAGRLTFSAGDSEAVDPAASLSSYEWAFGDGTRGAGPTVFHDYPLQGGNVTVRLTVTDSKGGRDSQALPLALKPGTASALFAYNGTATGASPVDCRAATPVAHAFNVTTAALPDGSAGTLARARSTLAPVGSAHALANLDLLLLDGNGTELGASEESGVEESIDVAFQAGAPPGSGSWNLQVLPCVAASVAYQGELELTWQATGNPAYLAWLATFDDGHSHTH